MTGPDPGAATIWIDGRLVPAAEARVSALDHGITVGDGVFETMKVSTGGDGVPHAFALRRHLRRLRFSASALGLDVGRDDEALRAAVRATLDANPGAGRVRLTITGGIGALGSEPPPGPATTIVATAPARPWPPTAPVVVVPWARNERSAVVGVKTTSYAENVVALAHAHRHGASEAVFANTAGNLCEGTGSNVFAVVDGRLLTPPLTAGCLAGITRELLLEALDVEVADVPIDRLRDASEAFLTSSTRDVHPIDSVDGVSLPAHPGPRTAEAIAAFARIEAGSLDP